MWLFAESGLMLERALVVLQNPHEHHRLASSHNFSLILVAAWPFAARTNEALFF
jgi:hypothetical protein